MTWSLASRDPVLVAAASKTKVSFSFSALFPPFSAVVSAAKLLRRGIRITKLKYTR